ncbi:hypothetical protein [Rossellomorea sp. NPDC077527]|uniref:hypothetical protein n=1 Tax=Rossellomorea sp. NPDC077527 TaxID=3364510 RepID=UPI0037C61173
MDHAFVFAAQQFLGFELCDALLEKGWTVTAIDENKAFEDKWLQIGRNANLEYVPYGDWNQNVNSECTVFLPYYDQLRGEKGSYLTAVDGLLGKMDQPPHVVRIYSNEFGIRNVESEGSIFYIPTLYGMHQPEDFLFAQLLMGREEISGFVDDPTGAIYVKDAARAIVNLSSKKERFILKPLSERSWNEALSYISDEEFSTKFRHGTPKGKEIIVRPSKSHESIIDQQRKGIHMHEIQE